MELFPTDGLHITQIENIGIVKDSLLYNVKTHPSCITHQLLSTEHNGSCRKTRLPPKYKQWILLPDRRTVIFYAEEVIDFSIICEGLREEYHSHHGILQLEPGCVVQDGTMKIVADRNIFSTAREVFASSTKMDLDNDRSKPYLGLLLQQTKLEKKEMITPTISPNGGPQAGLWIGMVAI